MATLIKVGDTFINLDTMTQAYFKPGSVRLYFAVATGKAGERHMDAVELFGRDAQAMRKYLEQNSVDVVAMQPQEIYD